jgi:hypothetical protein
MVMRRDRVAQRDRPVVNRIILMFALLALGDTGHVGFRVIAYARGGLAANPLLVGLGALSTALTVTFFYMILVDVWRLRYNRPLGVAGWLLIATGVVRLAIMALPQNHWEQVIAPYDWSLLRNALLVIQGVGVMVLIFRDAYRTGDRPFKWIGWMIAASYAFYAPVILWVGQAPAIGMLMIPKTCAYVAIAIISYNAFYRSAPSASPSEGPRAQMGLIGK